MDATLVGDRVISAPGSGPDSQNVRLLSHYNAGPYRLRVQIQVDTAYVSQSRTLVCEVWRPSLGWTEVSTLLYSEVGKMKRIYNEETKQELLRLEALLLERALWVLEAE